jgi:hypothetical protein
MMVLAAIYSVSQAWFSVNPVVLVQLCKKFLQNLKDHDFQGFPNKAISESEIFDMACAISSENINAEPMKNGYKVMHVKWASSTCQTL